MSRCQRQSKIGPRGGVKVDHLARGERCQQEGHRPVSRALWMLTGDWPLWPARRVRRHEGGKFFPDSGNDFPRSCGNDRRGDPDP